jgi:hypothetical protein
MIYILIYVKYSQFLTQEIKFVMQLFKGKLFPALLVVVIT